LVLLEFPSVICSVCMALEIDKYFRKSHALKSTDRLSLIDEKSSKSFIEKIEDVKHSEVLYPSVSILCGIPMALIPLYLRAYGSSGFLWCWIDLNLSFSNKVEYIILVLLLLYAWVFVSIFVIIFLSFRIMKYKQGRYLILLGVFIAVWLPPTTQRIGFIIFNSTPYWMHYLQVLTSNLKGTLYFTIVIVILYGDSIMVFLIKATEKLTHGTNGYKRINTID